MTRPHDGISWSLRTSTNLIAALATGLGLIGVTPIAAAEDATGGMVQTAHAQFESTTGKAAGAQGGGADERAGGAEGGGTEGGGAEAEHGEAGREGIDEGQHLAVITLGATGERELADRFTHVGPAVGIEVEPIEHWLEVELGASAYRRRGVKGFEVEMPFKVPFELAEGFEVMPGVGPTWTHTSEDGTVSRRWGAEVLIDFFYWPTRQAGWYLVPSYGSTLGATRQRSAALSFGVFFAVP